MARYAEYIQDDDSRKTLDVDGDGEVDIIIQEEDNGEYAGEYGRIMQWDDNGDGVFESARIWIENSDSESMEEAMDFDVNGTIDLHCLEKWEEDNSTNPDIKECFLGSEVKSSYRVESYYSAECINGTANGFFYWNLNYDRLFNNEYRDLFDIGKGLSSAREYSSKLKEYWTFINLDSLEKLERIFEKRPDLRFINFIAQ